MVKKFKLIKKYPNSPKLGFEISIKEEFPHVYPAEVIAGCDTYVSLEMCENNPEFWERIKDYEILETISKSGEYHAVERLSDKEIFRIGDRVQLETTCGNFWESKDCKINKITIENNNVEFHIKEKDNPIFKYAQGISRWRKVKKPLFTTEDGVDIFDKDNYWIANSYNWSFWENTSVNNWVGSQDYIHTFSTKDAAQEYVDKNKPKYSEKDMLDFATDYTSTIFPYNKSVKKCFNNWKLKNGIKK